jgi:phosphate-selective porin OprO/OprP
MQIASRVAVLSLSLTLPGATWAQEKPAEPSAPATPSVIIKASSEGFSLSSPDKAFQLKLRGFLHVDGRFFASDADRPGATTFLIRRARPILDGTLFGDFDFRIAADFAGSTVVLFDAYGDFHPAKEVRLRVGKFKPSVGLERLQAATAIPFIERALPTNLVPNRDVGLQVHGDVLGGALNYAVGAFNGVPDGASLDTNLDDSFELVGRVFAHPFRSAGPAPLKGLGLGFGASRGQQFGTPTATEVAPLRSIGQQTFFSYRTGTPAAEPVVADGEHFRLTPQGYYYWGPFGVLAEYVSSTQEVKLGADRARLRHESWQATASYVLFGGSASFDGVRPEKPLMPSTGGWGAVEVAARYSDLHVDPDAFPIYADPARSARVARSEGAAVNWYLNSNVRISASFDHTGFEGGAADNGNRPSEDVFLSRFQFAW